MIYEQIPPACNFFNFLFSACQSKPKDSVVIKKKYFTKQLSSGVTLDGIPGEEAWNSVEWGGDFTQWPPNEGKPPAQELILKLSTMKKISLYSLQMS